MHYLNLKAHTIDFPETTYGMLDTLRKFIKDSKASEFSKMMKRIVEKIKENSKFITGKFFTWIVWKFQTN